MKVDDRIGILADETTDLVKVYSRELRHYKALKSYLKARDHII